MFASFFTKNNRKVKNQKITKLMQQYYFNQQNHIKKLLQKLGQQFILTMSTCTLIQIISTNGSKYNQVTQIPNIIKIIQQNVDIQVSQQHFLMSFGRLYQQKNISFIREVQKDLKEIILQQLQNNKNNLSLNSTMKSQTTAKSNNTINNNSKNNISSSMVKDKNNNNNLSSSSCNSLQFISKQQSSIDQSLFNVNLNDISKYDFTQNKNVNMSKTNKANIINQKNQQKGKNLIQSPFKQQQNNSLYNFQQIMNQVEKQDDIQLYLLKVKNSSQQLQWLTNFKSDSFKLQHYPQQINPTCFRHLVIFKGKFVDYQFYHEETGQGKSKNDARLQACFKVLNKVYKNNMELFRHFKQYKEKKALIEK